MSFPAQVLQQAQYDASVGGKNMPKTAFQRAQGFLRSKLMPGAPTPNPSTMTSQQQAAFDAKQGGRLLQEFNKTRTAGGPIGAGQNIMGGLVTGGLIGANLAGLKQVDNIIQEEGGYGKLGERMLGLITRTDGLEDFNKSQRPKASGTKIKIGEKLYDTGFHSKEIAELRKKSPGGGNAAQSTPATRIQAPLTSDPNPGTDPRNAEYLAARAGLKTDSTDEDIKKVEDIGMTAWAKANPKLAAKVKPGQSGYEQIFADKNKEKVMDMMKTLNNPNIKPFVEGVNVPSTNFTTNLTNDVPVDNYKGVMEDGAITELAKGLDLEAPQFNAQGFMNAFREDVINSPKAAESPGLGNTVDLPDVNNLISTLGEDEYFKRLDAGLLTRN